MQPSPEIFYQDVPTGGKLELRFEGAAVARVFIHRFQMRVGAAVIRAAAIGDVSTDEPYRRRGFMRLLMEEAVRRMRASDASISVLFGISDFYHKFGYATAGPLQIVEVEDLPHGTSLAAGWRARPATPDDLPAICALYDRNTAGKVGPLVRDPHDPGWSGRAWALLAAALQRPDAGECRMVEAPDGHPAAYCWRGSDLWPVRMIEQQMHDTMAFAEVMADSPLAAEAAIAACRAWACEENEKEEGRRDSPVTTLYFHLPHRSPIGVAAAFYDARLILRCFRSGGFMARTIHPRRLLAALLPELSARLRAGLHVDGVVHFVTDGGTAALRLGTAGPMLAETVEPSDGPLTEITLPQTALAWLALGAYPPQDVLERLDPAPDPRAAKLIAALFPLRRCHIYLPDWP
jgi:GNAT superfamily N-acetyltransferase